MTVASDFPLFSIDGVNVQFVAKFKCLGHFINNDFIDDDDIEREILNYL